jgi:UDP-GlcNAc:undecaprenyl-phosphate GlcNAc-1-phosphate transferase
VSPGLIAFAAALLLVGLTLPPLQRWALERGWVDAADHDRLKIHTRPVPYVGGIAAALGLSVALLAARPSAAAGSGLRWTVGAALAILAVGLLDDRARLAPSARLLLEALGASAMLYGLLLLSPERPPCLGAGWARGALFYGFGIFFVVGAINAVNMQDGLDGLAGGLAALSALGAAWAGWTLADGITTTLALALAGALLGFLLYNLPPARVFLGDNGSYFVGAVVAALALRLLLVECTPRRLLGAILLVGLPVADAAAAIARRLRHRASPLSGDRDHFYDRLRERGHSTSTVLALAYFGQLVAVVLAVLLLSRPR